MKSSKLSWRINKEILAPNIRVIDAFGKQVGVLTKSEALEKAAELGVDLIEIAPNATPPVAKLIDFGKFRYQEEKKLKSEAKKTRGVGEIKEIRYSPFIAENDYNTRLERIKEFLSSKNKVRLVVVFTGRQMKSTKFGYELMKRVLTDLGDSVAIDMEPKFLGRRLGMVISPVNKSKKK